MTDNRKPPCNGWTLVELLVVMSVSVMITSITITLMVSLWHQQRSMASCQNHQEALSRLAEQFRADVRAATSVANEPFEREGQAADVKSNVNSDVESDVQFICRLPDGRAVRYAVVNGRLRRLGPGAAEQDARETYSLSEGTVVSWSIDQEAATAELVVDYPIAGADSMRRRLPIVARVGRDLLATVEGPADDGPADDDEPVNDVGEDR